VITILGLVLIFGGIYGWLKLLTWVISRAERIECEPMPDPPCRMCDKPATGPDHDCADPPAAELAKALLTPDCPSIVAGSDIDASQWAGIVAQLPELAEIDAKRLEDLYLIPNQE